MWQKYTRQRVVSSGLELSEVVSSGKIGFFTGLGAYIFFHSKITLEEVKPINSLINAFLEFHFLKHNQITMLPSDPKFLILDLKGFSVFSFWFFHCS